MDVNTIKFRCSSLGYLMTEPKSAADKKAGNLSETAKTHLIDVYVSWRYKRREEITGKFLEKGNAREEDSITLLSLNQRRAFFKNKERSENDFITGEFDLSFGTPIEETIDTKTSWSAHTFFRAIKSKLEHNYKWQGVGYMWLTGAKKHTVAYCLVNGTADAIRAEKFKLAYKYIDAESSEEYREKCKQIEINHIFDIKSFIEENPKFDFHNDVNSWSYDIPLKDRVHTFTFERNEEEINAIKSKVIAGRNWIKENFLNK